MTQDTDIKNLIINKLTKAQYESIANPDPTQLYFITDEVISSADVINALGYTPYNATNPDGYITSADLSNYVTNSTLATTLADYVTNSTLTATLADYALLSDIPTVPTTDQTYNGASTNPQSGTAVAEAIANVTTPIATSTTVGTIKPDNTTTKVDANGTLSAISRNVGEIVQSTLPLTDAGLHLLDGALIQGDGIYKEFVDYIAELYTEIQASGYKLNVNKVGSLTDNNGVLSGFSTNNYAIFPNNFQPGTNPWEMVFKVTTGNDVITEQYVCAFQKGSTNETRYATRIYINRSSKFCISITYNGTAWDIVDNTTGGAMGSYTVLPNTTYYIKFQWTGSAYILSYSLDGENYTQDCYVASTTPMYNSCTYCPLGAWNSGVIATWLGSIDLKESYININGQRWWTGAEAIKPCFCTETEWQNSVTTYGSCGKFVYNSTNNTVRLPKVSDILQGTTDLSALGDLVVSGLPQHTHTRGTMEISGSLGDVVSSISSGASGAFNWWDSGAMTGTRDLNQPLMASDFYASRNWTGSTSNANYTSTTATTSKVQPQTIKTLLYIVIATSSKTDIQVDIDEITTDLNGKVDTDLSNLNASGQAILDNKANISLSNINNTGKILISNMGMPSNTRQTLTVPASESTLTAPTNGYFKLIGDSLGAGSFLIIQNTTTQLYSYTIMPYQLGGGVCWVPFKKGDTCLVVYNNVTNLALYFIPAQGSESEVQ